jgi:hypothetical protein
MILWSYLHEYVEQALFRTKSVLFLSNIEFKKINNLSLSRNFNKTSK